ncbi:MAG TPA: hypothetical protein VKU41_02165 [Polyangiaceae bacterium]|nr:hypothetical protein [Polyangiaceae bacterium]
MAYPSDPSSPAPGDKAAFANARLSADDFDRLAAAFRPSWELDDAPFTGPGSMSPSEIQAVQGGGVRADVRAMLQASNGTHAAQVPAGLNATAPVPAAPPMTTPVMARPAPEISRAPRPVEGALTRPAVARPASLDLEDGFAPRPSKKRLWIAMGAGAAVAAIVGIWASSGHDTDKAAPPVVSVDLRAPTNGPSIPPPPPETATATAASTSPPAATTTQAAPLAPPPVTTHPVLAAPAPAPSPVIATTPVTALPQAPAHFVAPPPRPAAPPPPPPKPAPHKSAPTIVRDVPF